MFRFPSVCFRRRLYWSFNTAYATEFGNMRAFVTRLYSMSQIEQ
jgi:hypothetical protein